MTTGSWARNAASRYAIDQFAAAGVLRSVTTTGSPRAISPRAFASGRRGITLRMRWCYAQTFYRDPAATLDDLREAVNTLEDTDRIARRVLGGAHPLTRDIEKCLRVSRASLRAREAGKRVVFEKTSARAG